jgi:hypothetical protein
MSNDNHTLHFEQLRASSGYYGNYWAKILGQVKALYMLEAIRDAEGVVHYLEMNSNPAVHPLVYPLMLRDIVHLQQPFRSFN